MDTCSTQRPTAGHVAQARDQPPERIVTFHYNHFEGRSSLLQVHHHHHHRPPPPPSHDHDNNDDTGAPRPLPAASAPRRAPSLFRVFVTGVPVARSAIIDLGSELELRSVRLHYQYDIHLVTKEHNTARIIISYLLTRDPDDDPCFVNLFRYIGPLPPDEPVLGPVRAPPATRARYIRIQALFRPCVPPIDHNTPKWKVVEITAASLSS